jgi:hypothetical protein
MPFDTRFDKKKYRLTYQNEIETEKIVQKKFTWSTSFVSANIQD